MNKKTSLKKVENGDANENKNDTLLQSNHEHIKAEEEQRLSEFGHSHAHGHIHTH